MPQIELIRPLELSPTGGSVLTIKNLGVNNVFYGTTSSVSSANKTGTIAEGESLTLESGYVWVVAEKTASNLGPQKPVILDLKEKAISSGGGGVPSGAAGGDLGGTYPNPEIGAEKVTAAKIGNEAVTTGKVKTGAIEEGQLATNSVVAAKIKADAVETAKIKNEAVTNEKVKSGTLEKNRLTALAISELEAAGGPPSGAAGGDLTGTYPNPTLAAEKVVAAAIKKETITSEKVLKETLTKDRLLKTVQEEFEAGGPPTGAAGGVLGGTYPNPAFAAEKVETAAIKKENVTREKLSAGVQTELEAIAGGTPGVVSVLTYATTANGKTKLLTDCTMAAGSKTLKCATTKPFVEADVGKSISVGYAGAAKVPLKTTIATFVSSGEVTLTAAATLEVTEVGGRTGPDDTAVFQEAIDALNAKGGGTLLIPALNKNGEQARWSVTRLLLHNTAKKTATNLTIMAYGAKFTNILGEGKPFWHTNPTEEEGVYLADRIAFYGGIYEGTGYEASQEHIFSLAKVKDITFRDVYAKNWAGVSGNASTVYCQDSRRVKVESCTFLECAASAGGAQNAVQVDWATKTGSTTTPFTELIVTNNIVTSGQCALNVNVGAENLYNNTAPLRLIVANNYLEAFGTSGWNAFSLEIGGNPPARSQYEQISVTGNIFICKGTKEAGNSTAVQFVNSSSSKILEPEQFTDITVVGNVMEAARHGIYSNACRCNINGNVIKANAAAVLCENTGSGTYTYPLTGVRVTQNVLKMGVSTFPETGAITMTKCVRGEILDNLMEWENGEVKTVEEACVNSGSKILRTVVSKPWVQGDTGKTIKIPEAGVAKATLTTKIIAVLSAEEIEIETAATETVGKTISDAKITTGTKILTSVAKPFVAGDKGKKITIPGADTGKQHLVTEIETVTSETEVKISGTAKETVPASGYPGVAYWGGVTVTTEALPTNKHKGVYLKNSENCILRGTINYCPSEAIYIEGGGAHKILPGTVILNAFSKPGATGPAILLAGTLNGHIWLEGAIVTDVKGTSAMTFGVEITGTPGGFHLYTESNTFIGWKSSAWHNAVVASPGCMISMGDITKEEPPQEYTTYNKKEPEDTGQKYNAGDKAWNGAVAASKDVVLWVCWKSGTGTAAEWDEIKAP